MQDEGGGDSGTRATRSGAHAALVARDVPARRPGSIRRTSSMEMSWPDGHGQAMLVTGNARDMITPEDGGAPRVLAADSLSARIGPDRIIKSFVSAPPLPAGVDLIGQHALERFRKAIQPALDAPEIATRPLVLLLDDVVGSSIVSGWLAVKMAPPFSIPFDRARFENVCTAYAFGSPALSSGMGGDLIAVPPLARDDDPDAFHAMASDRDGTVRRARRIDVWREAGGIAIDAMFQDSGMVPGSPRSGIHEYRVLARGEWIDGRLVLAEVEAIPGILPYAACRGAPDLIGPLLGMPLAALRASVLTTLRGPAGCTHLNDALRSLAETPILYGHLGNSEVEGR